MTGKPHKMMHSILAQESDRRVLQKHARRTAMAVTCFLTITLAMSANFTAPPTDGTAARAASGVAEGTPYFPSQYRLDAPDTAPAHIEAF